MLSAARLDAQREEKNMSKQVVFDYSKAGSFISQEEIDASQKLADEMGIPLKVRIYS